MNTKTVTVPLSIWGRLATEAESRGVTVEDILVTAINNVIRPTDRHGLIVAAVRAGYTDGEIAAYVTETRAYVANIRREAGLPANRDKGQRRIIGQKGNAA